MHSHANNRAVAHFARKMGIFTIIRMFTAWNNCSNTLQDHRLVGVGIDYWTNIWLKIMIIGLQVGNISSSCTIFIIDYWLQLSVIHVTPNWVSSYKSLNPGKGVLHLTSNPGVHVGRDPSPQALNACYLDMNMGLISHISPSPHLAPRLDGQSGLGWYVVHASWGSVTLKSTSMSLE